MPVDTEELILKIKMPEEMKERIFDIEELDNGFIVLTSLGRKFYIQYFLSNMHFHCPNFTKRGIKAYGNLVLVQSHITCVCLGLEWRGDWNLNQGL